MAHRQLINDLSEAEILELIQKKRKPDYQERLAKYRKSGKAIVLSGETQDLTNTDRVVDPSEVQSPARKSNSASLINKALPFVEIIVIILLLGVTGYGAKTISQLNQQSASQWSSLPTLTPTPIISAVVLPDGHTPPDAFGNSKPNDQEIPPHLRAVVAAYAALPTPTSAPQQGIRIQIPALQIDSPIVQGDDWEQLKKGVAQHLGSANPGENGNLVLSGHNDTYGEVFRYLDRLKPGDTIKVFTYSKTYTYTVTGWILVEPTQVEVMDPTPDATLTLISCYPYLVDNKRIIVKAKLAKT